MKVCLLSLLFHSIFFFQLVVWTTSHFYFSIQLLSRRLCNFLLPQNVDFERRLSFIYISASGTGLKTVVPVRLYSFFSTVFNSVRSMPSGESDWVTVTSAQGSKMCFRLKQIFKKGFRSGTYTFLVGNNLSLFRTLP